MNVVRQTVSKWEQGLSVPDADMLLALSEALETPVSVLLGETVVEPEADTLQAISQKLEVINLQLALQENRQKEGGPLGAHFVLRPVGTAVRGPPAGGQPLFGVGLQRPGNRRPWRDLSLLGMAVCPGGAASLSGCAGWDFLHL